MLFLSSSNSQPCWPCFDASLRYLRVALSMSLFNFHVCLLFVFLTCARLQPNPSRPYVTSVKPRLFPEQAVDTYTDVHTHTHLSFRTDPNRLQKSKQSIPAPDVSLPGGFHLREGKKPQNFTVNQTQVSLSPCGTRPQPPTTLNPPPPLLIRSKIHISR